jgi:hypothetical protein
MTARLAPQKPFTGQPVGDPSSDLRTVNSNLKSLSPLLSPPILS